MVISNRPGSGLTDFELCAIAGWPGLVTALVCGVGGFGPSPDEWLNWDLASGWAIIGVSIQTVAVRIRVFEHVWKVLQAKTEVYPMLQVELSNQLISAVQPAGA